MSHDDLGGRILAHAFHDELEKIAIVDIALGAGVGALAAGKGRREKGAARGALGGLGGSALGFLAGTALTRNVPASLLTALGGATLGGFLAGRTARKTKTAGAKKKIDVAQRLAHEGTERLYKAFGGKKDFYPAGHPMWGAHTLISDAGRYAKKPGKTGKKVGGELAHGVHKRIMKLRGAPTEEVYGKAALESRKRAKKEGAKAGKSLEMRFRKRVGAPTKTKKKK